MQAEDVRSNECVAETIVDLSLATVLEEEKFKNDLRSQWNTWRSQVR
jgi:hypothetical protein